MLDPLPSSVQFTWITTSSPTSLVFPVLPYHLTLLPSIFRFMAFLCFVPVLILALTDILGWAFFKLVLRPLGYASTIRFKDPEPSTLLTDPLAQPTISSTARARSTSRRRSASRPRTAKPNVISSSDDLVSEQQLPSPPLSASDSSSASSSSSNSPIIDIASSLSSRSPSLSPLNLSVALPGTEGTGPGMLRERSSSTSSSISAGMRRQRAPSVGVEGPLFGLERGSDDETEGDRDNEPDTPTEGLGLMTGEEDDDTATPTGTLRRRGNVPRGGPAFGFTVMGDEDYTRSSSS